MIFLTFGTGLGAGLIFNGRLYEGANGNAGEIGHIRLKKKGSYGYGKEGTFEGFCSGGGIARLAAQAAQTKKEIPRCVTEMGGVEKITAKKLAEYAFGGDRFALKVFEKSGEMLGYGLAAIIDALNPERIVIGGVYMRSQQLLMPAMRKVLEREALKEALSACTIVPAELRENVGDYAAVTARAAGMKIILLSGRTGGAMKEISDVSVIVSENETYKIQELHLPLYHCLCAMLENEFFGE